MTSGIWTTSPPTSYPNDMQIVRTSVLITSVAVVACNHAAGDSGVDATATVDADLVDCAGSFRVETMSELEPLRHCRTIAGSLEIRDNDSVISLAALANLTSVNGHVEIRGLTGLADLDGLDALVSVGGYLEVRSNPALINVRGLHVLATVASYFEIMDNLVLSTLGLDALRSVGAYLQISDNPALPECQADAVNTQIGGGCDCERNGTGPC